MLRRDVWDSFPFDEEVTNIEDRVWGKAVTEAGYHIIYDSEAAVFHHHGLHQGNTPERAKGVVSIIERVDEDFVNELPHSLKPEHANIVAVVPILGRIEHGSLQHQLLEDTLEQLSKARYVDNIYVLSLQNELAKGFKWINRADIPNADAIGLDELMQRALVAIEAREDYPEALLFVSYDYLSRPGGLIDELIFDAQYKGYDTAFSGFVDYGHYWVRTQDNQFRQTDSSMKSRTEREPIFRALYGLGCVTAASVIRQGDLVGGRIGILPIREFKCTIRVQDLDAGSQNDFYSLINSGASGG
jgi:hypothetical protein